MSIEPRRSRPTPPPDVGSPQRGAPPAMERLRRRRDELRREIRQMTAGRRYFVGALASIGFVWLIAIGYLLLPVRYVSQWTMIVPASYSGATVTLESIGQTSTSPGQPFGSVSLSPKVIYREILTSDRVRKMAAARLDPSYGAIAKPRVKLVDETSLLLGEASGSTAEEARDKAQALIAAFGEQLDILRRDEIDKRAAAVRGSLAGYQSKLDASRGRILGAQRDTGLLSLNQFNEAASTMELIRRKLADLRSDLSKLVAEQQSLSSRIGMAPEDAAASLKLFADPSFARLAVAFAEADTVYKEQALRLGPKNPVLMAAKSKRDSIVAQLIDIARRADFYSTEDLLRVAVLANNSQQADLFRQIVNVESAAAGRRKEVETLEAQLAQLDLEVKRMSADSARLEDLKKDHLVAEAVFTTAVARLDTNRTDIYASYPIVQVLAEPDLPENPAHPRLLYALLAGVFASLLLALAWGLAWQRRSLISSLLKSA